MSLNIVITIYIMPMAKLPIMSSFAKSLNLISFLMCLAAIKVIILYNAKSPIRLKISLIILGNLSADQLVPNIY